MQGTGKMSKQGKPFVCMNTGKEGMPKTMSCALRVSMDKLRRAFLSFVKEVASCE